MKALLQLAGLFIAVLFALLAFGDMSAGGLSAYLTKLEWEWLGLALVSLGLSCGMRSARWLMMLRRFKMMLPVRLTWGKPRIDFSRVVFPAPVGPATATSCPGSSRRSIPFKTWVLP